MLKFLAGWKAYVIGGALILAFGFTSGWIVNGWRHSASELGKLEDATEDTNEREEAVGEVAAQTASETSQITQDNLTESQRMAAYVEATDACRIGDAGIGVWYKPDPTEGAD